MLDTPCGPWDIAGVLNERGGVMSAIEIPEGSLFGLDNLPYGIFAVGGAAPRAGVRVADSVIDLTAALRDEVFAAPALNPFMAEGPARWAAARARITELVTAGEVPSGAIHPVREVELRLPFDVADYVDFYASEHHAANLGRLFRPGAEPLTPNWKHLPVGYHGRAGTVVVSGTNIIRPSGQRKGPGDQAPVFGPSVRLDIEAEVGFVVGAGSPHGTAVPTSAFAEHVFGAVLVNDWSARDLQAWEYVPLGPHLGKSFATSVSPWVVPLAALLAARVPLPGQDPAPLPYLRESEDWGLDIDLVVDWNGEVVSRPPYASMYWSPAQMLAHMTVNGASTRTGDLFASGTVSGPARAERGAFIELTWGGAEPVTVKGEPRTFLQDGDTVTITATAPGASGGRIGFGEVTATILPTRTTQLPAEP
jgi:fumarylacetoacetase